PRKIPIVLSIVLPMVLPSKQLYYRLSMPSKQPHYRPSMPSMPKPPFLSRSN
ncbi:hypothetical protein MMC29_005947, partial [Sticta canariensis]|nr:hypothetical protein [Sticta canariensis]